MMPTSAILPEHSKRFMIDKMADRLMRHHEGVSLMPYHDTAGKLTIGVGRNLTDRGLTPDEVNLLLTTDIDLARTILSGWLPFWATFPIPAQLALLSMAFNLGGPRLSGFMKMRAAILAEDWERASAEALNSKWSEQVGARSHEISELLRGNMNVPALAEMASYIPSQG